MDVLFSISGRSRNQKKYKYSAADSYGTTYDDQAINFYHDSRNWVSVFLEFLLRLNFLFMGFRPVLRGLEIHRTYILV